MQLSFPLGSLMKSLQLSWHSLTLSLCFPPLMFGIVLPHIWIKLSLLHRSSWKAQFTGPMILRKDFKSPKWGLLSEKVEVDFDPIFKRYFKWNRYLNRNLSPIWGRLVLVLLKVDRVLWTLCTASKRIYLTGVSNYITKQVLSNLTLLHRYQTHQVKSNKPSIAGFELLV